MAAYAICGQSPKRQMGFRRTMFKLTCKTTINIGMVMKR